MLSWMRNLYFSVDGRLDRPAFIRRYVALYVIVFVAAVIAVFKVLDTATRDTDAMLISGAAGSAILLGSIPLLMRRFHDLNLSGEAVVAYLLTGGVIFAVRAAALQSQMIPDALHGGWLWSFLGYLPGLIWALVPFLAPGSSGENHFGLPYVRRRFSFKHLSPIPTPLPTPVAF